MPTDIRDDPRFVELFNHQHDDHGRFDFGDGSTKPIHVSDVNEAVRLLGEGKNIELDSTRQVSTVLHKVRAIVADAKSKGQKAPNYNLCGVSVAGTSIFCAQTKGIPRLQMPQLSGHPLEGSKAADLPPNNTGNVNISAQFRDYLTSQGARVTDETEMASYMKASQNELNGAKVADILNELETGKPPGEGTVWLSSDNYIIDGHHRWAANIGAGVGSGDDDVSMPVTRVNLPILDVLAKATVFSKEWGIPQTSSVQFSRTAVDIRPGVQLALALGTPVELSYSGTGLMVAVFLPADVAAEYALPGGEEPDDLHVTLAFLGKTGDYSGSVQTLKDKLVTALTGVARNTPPVRASLSGTGQFGPDSKNAFYYSVDAASFPELRRLVVASATAAGFKVATDHGFTPHCTIKYLADGEGQPRTPLEKETPFTFSHLTVSVAGQNIDIPFGGKGKMKLSRYKARTRDDQFLELFNHDHDDKGRFGFGDGGTKAAGLKTFYHGAVPADALNKSAPSDVSKNESQFSPTEVKALSQYKAVGMVSNFNSGVLVTSQDINNVLRGQPLTLDDGHTEAQVRTAVAKTTPDLDSVIAKSTLAEPTQVWRGYHASSMPLEAGDVIHDKGFLSTSTDSGVAMTFAEGGAGTTYDHATDPATLELTLPAGTHAVAFGGNYAWSEGEVLLGRNTSIRVDSVEKDQYGVVRAKGTLL